MIGCERSNVRRRRSRATQERPPEIVETGKLGGNFDRLTLNASQPDRTKQIAERFELTDGKPRAFIEVASSWIRACGDIPERAKELHSLGVVPHAGGDGAAAGGNGLHFVERRLRIRKEVESE
jgi:hypothetical protein